jgi:hypothetical protein
VCDPWETTKFVGSLFDNMAVMESPWVSMELSQAHLKFTFGFKDFPQEFCNGKFPGAHK